MKKLLSVFILLAFCLSAAGCIRIVIGGEPGPTETEPAGQDEDPIPEPKYPLFDVSNVDEDLGLLVPLGVDKVQLYTDGTLVLFAYGELKDALGEEIFVADDVKNVDVLPFGNGGYRSIIFIRTDGTVSAVSTSALITSKEIVILDHLGDCTDGVSFISTGTENGFRIDVVDANGDTFQVNSELE